MNFRDFFIVFKKEVMDATRDRRTLMRLMIPAVLMGPLMLSGLSGLIASLENQAEQREIVISGIENAPSLRNYLERQTYTIKAPPADYEAQLHASKLSDPVVVVPKDFETDLQNGDAPQLTVVVDSSNTRARAGSRSVRGALEGFVRERASLALAWRGVQGGVTRPVEIQELDLANSAARAAQLTGMIPMFVIMAVLYGALTASLDSTAGERERGSLEPLLTNPVSHGALVAGKWGAVALLGMAVALLSALGFIPAQWLIKSDSLQAMFRFGFAEAGIFWLLQLPLAAGMGALLMAMAIRSKTYKEAQAGSTLVLTAVSLSAVIPVFNPGGDAPWYYWVPGLSQSLLMNRVLRGDELLASQLIPGVITAVVLTVLALGYVVRSMRVAAAR